MALVSRHPQPRPVPLVAVVAPPQPHSDYLATVTEVTQIDASLFGVRCRLADGTVGVIVIPKGLVTVVSVVLTVQACMDILKIEGVI